MKNILVTIGFNENDHLLIDQAHKLAQAFQSKVWLIHIAAPEPDFAGYAGPPSVRDMRAEELREEHRAIQDLANQLTAKNIDAEGLLVQGATIETIMEEAKKLQIDLIIAGHEEHNFFYKAFRGSVSVSIINTSKIPVLIVPID
ncbi:MAG: universal stress protein [Chitinophagales bacterium]